MKRKYNDADTLREAIESYWEDRDAKDKPYTYSGLALHLGFASRQSLWEYQKRDDELSLPIKEAMLKLESSYEELLHNGSCTGAIFALKNRGWTDKQELELSGGIEVDTEFKIVKGPDGNT